MAPKKVPNDPLRTKGKTLKPKKVSGRTDLTGWGLDDLDGMPTDLLDDISEFIEEKLETARTEWRAKLRKEVECILDAAMESSIAEFAIVSTEGHADDPPLTIHLMIGLGPEEFGPEDPTYAFDLTDFLDSYIAEIGSQKTADSLRRVMEAMRAKADEIEAALNDFVPDSDE